MKTHGLTEVITDGYFIFQFKILSLLVNKQQLIAIHFDFIVNGSAAGI